MASPESLRAQTAVPWTRVVVLGLFGAAGLAGALKMFVSDGPGTGFAAFVFAAIGGALAWAAFASARPYRIVLTREGIEWRGQHPGEYAWKDVEGLGAVRVVLPGIAPFTRYHVYLRDTSDLILTSNWESCDAVLGSLQVSRFEPGRAHDADAALLNAPRGDAADALGTDPSGVSRFVRAAAKGFEQAGLVARISERRLQAVTDEGIYELFSIGRVCMAARENEWTTLVADHLKKVRAARRAMRDFLDANPSFDAARDRLRVQLSPVRDASAHDVARPLEGTELRETVVIDFEDSESRLPKSALERWGVAADAVFSAARANNASDPPLTRREFENSPLVLFTGDRASARALAPGELVDLDPRFGAIVAFAAQDAALVMPVRDVGDLMQLSFGPLAATFDEIRARAPRPLGGVFWWHRGTLTAVPRVMTATGITWIVPDDLSGRLVGRIADTG